MSKRLVRLFGERIVRDHPFLPPDVPLNVVLRNGNTFFGRMVSLKNNVLQLKDARNHLHSIATGDIDVVIYDQVSR